MHSEYKTLKSIFDKYGVFTVPYYQRKYVWNTANKGRNLYKFIDDIVGEYLKSTMSQYFIGSFAICDHDSVADIVDGQQRITSLIVLLSILAENKCSSAKKAEHQKNVYKNGGVFILQEPFYLTEEMEGALGYKPYNGTGFKVKLDETVIKIKDQINRNYGSLNQNQFDGLYDYILNNVYAINIEYTNVSDALRYFLNINSLSVELTQSEIFYTILSQALFISHNTTTIFAISEEVNKIKNDYKGIKTPEDVLRIFIQAVYAKDPNINDLDELGVGKWMSYYHIEVFSDAIYAYEFCNKFCSFLKDLTDILEYFYFKTPGVNESSPLYLSYVLLKYENDFDLIEMLNAVFKYRHNYSSLNLYVPGSSVIDKTTVEDISRRLNLTLINNYIRDSNKRLDGFISNIELNPAGLCKVRIADIFGNINVDNVFVLNYLNSFQSNPKIAIKDKSRLIKVVFALQEAFLNHSANPSVSMNRYVAELLDGSKYTIEHLFSAKEFTDSSRMHNWVGKGTFDDAASFDTIRAKFENLSLLDINSNASANDDTLYDKLIKYKNARSILAVENEFLIQSLVPGSAFYSNPEISKLGLPNREIVNIVANTWELSPNNRDFNKKLLSLALQELTI